MALDGAFLRHLKKEIETAAVGARVDKIYQPNREEMLFSLRTRNENYKLLLSARANSARVHFTKFTPENPKQPPMLCMLLRKKLGGAKLVAVRQPELERMLCLDFDAVNELGDEVRLTVVIEVMGKYSNIILVDGNGKIVDALKRVDAEMSSERLVLPGLTYLPPPAQNKVSLLGVKVEEILHILKEIPKNMELSKALLSVLQGFSPIVCRELQHLAGHGRELFLKEMNQEEWQRLAFFLERTREIIEKTQGMPFMIVHPNQKPLDFSFLKIEQYGLSAIVREFSTFSELLDAFYEERDRIERMRVKEQDILRILSTTSDRLSRKINVQKEELKRCAERETLKIYGDLISANLYQIEKGISSVTLQNYYDPALPTVKINLDPAFSPSQNAQKYYKEYRKAKTAEEKLTQQIEQAKQELEYLDTVLDELSRVVTEKDLSEIRQELMEQGYVKMPRGKQKPPALSQPSEFESSEGFRILVGRNNRQNDKLTLKQAKNYDMWLHTKNIPGSHTVIVSDGKAITDQAILEAAKIAAWYSRGRDSSQVPVDYTQIRNVSKPQGAKPGMVIYVNYKTVYVTPENPEKK